MSYYRIDTLTNCARKYGNFLNDYEPYQEIREFRRINQKFEGFSSQPIIFERDKSYKNDEPISDFLLNDWGELIVSGKIYDMLKDKYSDKLDFYECFVREDDAIVQYHILRRKNKLDVLARDLYPKIEPPLGVLKTIVIDDIPEVYNIFDVYLGARNVISERLYKDLKALNPTNFEVSRIFTRSEHLKAKEKLTKKDNK